MKHTGGGGGGGEGRPSFQPFPVRDHRSFFDRRGDILYSQVGGNNTRQESALPICRYGTL